MIKGSTKAILRSLFSNKFGRIAKGVVTIMPPGPNKIFFITKGKLLPRRTFTYIKIVDEIRPKNLKLIAM